MSDQANQASAVPKKKIPHPSEANSDADHMKILQHALHQVQHGHYGVKDISVQQAVNEDGSVRITGTFTRYEKNPGVAAAHHGLELSGGAAGQDTGMAQSQA